MNNPYPGMPRAMLALRPQGARILTPQNRGPQQLRSKPLMRRYEATFLSRNGTTETFSRLAPAIAVFEQAFSAFARGTLITTPDGPISVEDLLPGDVLQTIENGPQTLLWTGTMTIFPATIPGQSLCPGPVRIPADSFGPGRPANDIVLGPYARLLQHSGHGPERDAFFVPVADLVDESSAIRLSPVTPVQVYHLGLKRHNTLRAGGLYVESYHPGAGIETLDEDMLSLFMTMFPHIRPSSGFGPLSHPQRPHAVINFRTNAA